MKYPKSLKPNSLIGITAPSAGIREEEYELFERSLQRLKDNDWNIVETKNVRSEGDVSSPAKQRAEEFLNLWKDDKVDAILCARGGDFLTDMLPYLEDQKLKGNCKWVMGASDPTNLLYYITTSEDIATLYGHNAGSFDSMHLNKSQEIALEYLKGNLVVQDSYDKYEKEKGHRENEDYNLTEQVEWKTNQDFDVEGRIIGGCLDCLRYLPGTKWDKTKEFVEKYKEDGIIWYFDIFNMSAEDVYLTLFELKHAGWFEHVKGIVVGRILFPSTYTSMTYERAFYETFAEIPVIIDADIGHVVPKMTIINGCIAHITAKNKKGRIEQFLK
jgi:muramoyltetrapeptide carboxypeptidase LdcA involved in peptidoglycan recycling